jgi:2-polyprenyl-3-methyl-5-hydroxy-6-metoxy-1,4-benzoquinol methylase
MTTTHQPATDLGHLLHKHPDRAQSFTTSSGVAHVFYPKATHEECTVALLLEVDPIALVRGPGSTLTQYVNDRPYAAGSLLTVALGSVFRTAMNGRSDSFPELAQTSIPLVIRIPALPHRLAERLFTPLGWTVEVTEHGDSRYGDVTLTGTSKVSDALNHLYVLLPVLDGGKHYWVAADEVDKLLRAGDGWLAAHPDKELITTRYLIRKRPLVLSALERLAEVDEVEPEARAKRVLDLGCGGGALLRELVREPEFTEIHGVDVSARALQEAARKLHLDRMSDRMRERITLRQSALTYADTELAGYDAAVLMEVVEHVDPSRLPALEHSVFVVARPAVVLVTTPNVEYNALFETLPEGQMRHSDHRFEWTRAEFAEWADGVASRRGYRVRYVPIGPEDAERGAPTQMAVFSSGDEN